MRAGRRAAAEREVRDAALARGLGSSARRSPGRRRSAASLWARRRSSGDRHQPRSWDHRACGLERRPVGGVAQQRLADALAEDARLAAGGAENRPARARYPWGSCDGKRPQAASVRDPGASRACLGLDTQIPPGPAPAARERPGGAGRSRPDAGACASPLGRPRRRPAAGRCASPAGRPASRSGASPRPSSRGDGESSIALIALELRAQRRRVEGHRDPLAPGRRAQPRQIDHVDPPCERVPARSIASLQTGSSIESSRRAWAWPSSCSSASG